MISLKFFITIVFLVSRNLAVSNTFQDMIENLMSKMELSEKLDMLHGIKGIYVGNIPSNERLGIPSLRMQDGPQGFRVTEHTGADGTTTAWPSALTVAATWDESLIRNWANSMATEFKGKGANVALAPGIGLARVPTAGRNFEYLCGEDPYFGSKIVTQVVQGLLSFY
jgi:beta-glucosidase